MTELIGIIAAFVLIIVMINRKNSLALSMGSASVIILIASGVPVSEMVSTVYRAAVDPETLDLALIVAIITGLAGLLNRYSFFDKMVNALRSVLGNDRLTLMLVPGLIGSMPMVGGAIVSAPIADQLGERLNLSAQRRSAANNIFRHSWYFVFPFMPTFILTTRLAGITVQELLLMQWPLAAAMLLAGYYFILVRPESPDTGPDEEILNGAGGEDSGTRAAAARDFVKYSSPILLSLLLYLGLGIHLAFSLALGLGLALVLLHFVQRHPDFSLSAFPVQFLQDVNYEIAGAMVAIMVFRAAIDQTATFDILMSGMLDVGIPLVLITGGLAAVMGFVSASHSSTIAVVIPVMAPMAAETGEPVAMYVMVAYCFAFLAYLISPLHLCQILTNDYFDVALLQVYRIYLPVLLSVAVTAIAVVLLTGAL